MRNRHYFNLEKPNINPSAIKIVTPAKEKMCMQLKRTPAQSHLKAK